MQMVRENEASNSFLEDQLSYEIPTHPSHIDRIITRENVPILINHQKDDIENES